MKISEAGLFLIKQSEGCKLVAYKCPAGVWTIGYGWTHAVDGKPIAPGMTISKAKADKLLREGVQPFEEAVNKAANVPLNQGQYDALVSFTYNLGAGALRSSTLLRKLNAGDYPGAANEFPKWVKAGGKIQKGLVTRRAAEREMFLNGSFAADAIISVISAGLGAISATK